MPEWESTELLLNGAAGVLLLAEVAPEKWDWAVRIGGETFHNTGELWPTRKSAAFAAELTMVASLNNAAAEARGTTL